MKLFSRKKKAEAEVAASESQNIVTEEKSSKNSMAILVMEAVYENKKKEFVNAHVVFDGPIPSIRDLNSARDAKLDSMQKDEATSGVKKLTIVNLIPYAM